MRAKIIKKEGKLSYLVCEDGSFRILKTNSKVGDEINVASSSKRLVTTATVVFILLIAVFAGVMLSEEIHSKQTLYYLYVGVSPTVRFHVSDKDKIIDLSGLGKEGEALAGKIWSSVKDKDVKVGVKKLFTLALTSGSGIVIDEQNESTITVVSDNKNVRESKKKMFETVVSGLPVKVLVATEDSAA